MESRIAVTLCASTAEAMAARGPGAETHVVEMIERPTAFGHVARCPCCAQPGEMVAKLLTLFQDRARGKTSFFKDIILVAPRAEFGVMEERFEQDPILSALFVVQGRIVS